MRGYTLAVVAAAAALQVAAVPMYTEEGSTPEQVPMYRDGLYDDDLYDDDLYDDDPYDDDPYDDDLDDDDLYDDDMYDVTSFSRPLSQCSPPSAKSTVQTCEVNAFPTCNMTEVGPLGCPLANLRNNQVFNIIPGSNTVCLNESSPFFFQVMPANPKKLLIWFYGGGACWNDDITELGACAGYPGGPDYTLLVDVNAKTSTGGLMNRSIEDSPFHEYTLVALPYCSGDAFVGNRVRTYINSTTKETIAVARQAGSNNTMSVLTWVFDNYPNITSLLVAGCSAGSLGAQAWGNYIYLHYSNLLGRNAFKGAVLADGYQGIFPENQRSLLAGFAPQNSPWMSILPPDFPGRLANSSLFWCEITNFMQDQLPNVTYAATQGGHDAVQISYFNALAASSNMSYSHGPNTPACANGSVPVYNPSTMGPQFLMKPAEFFNFSQQMYEDYMNTGSPNFLPYYVNTSQHCFLEHNNVFRMSVVDTRTGRTVKLLDWLDDIPLDIDDLYDVNDPEVFVAVCDTTLPCRPEIADHAIEVVNGIDVSKTLVPAATPAPAPALA